MVLYILTLNYDVQEILTIVGSMENEALQENGMQFDACGKGIFISPSIILNILCIVNMFCRLAR